MKLFNTMSREVEEFRTLEQGKVKLYACGLTVYSQPHIGNWVAYIYWDTLVRILKQIGLEVEHVQNITDVGHLTSDEDAGEDKMLAGALREGLTAWEVADKYISIAENEAYEELGLRRPTHMPRATQYIDQQIELIKTLEEKGYTYKIEDGVYFDTSKLSDYGKLARLDIEGLQFGARVEATGKKNPTDFALWKFSPEGQKRDMEWESPWGKGFPGWHLECSAMIHELLGDTIDIHTGGIDHIPVHHTNEIAQSETATGKPLAQYWLHTNHIKVNGTKISKSLGNGFTLNDIKEKGYSLEAFKVMILSKHYRTEGNFTWEILEASQNRLNRWLATSDQRWQVIQTGNGYDERADKLHNEFSQALLDDLGTHKAIAKVDEMMELVEKEGMTSEILPSFTKLIQLINQLLGVNLFREDISDEQKQLIKEREAARKSQDWAKSDVLRGKLKQQSIEVRDSPSGTIWSRV
jgi:cysteinyl-tRNA synthetase